MAEYSNTMMPDMVAFDLDGTLTKPGKLSGFFAQHAEGLVMRGLVLAHHFYSAAKALKNIVNKDIHLGEDLKRRLLSYAATPRDGAAAMVDGIKGLGVNVTLLSNGPRQAWGERLARHFNFGSGFDMTTFREDMEGFLKPDPRNLLAQIKRFAGDKNSKRIVWMVGDQAGDMKTAIAANEKGEHDVIPVAMGIDSPAARYLRESYEGNYRIVESCDQLLGAIKTLRGLQEEMASPSTWMDPGFTIFSRQQCAA